MAQEFIKLQWKKDAKKKIKAPKKKSTKNPFKKGSWKSYLWKKLTGWKTTRNVENFHFVKAENIFIYKKDKPKVIFSKKRLDKETLEKLQSKRNDCYVLINSTEGMFTKIDLKSYIKLLEIDKIAIECKMQCLPDGEDEYDDVMEDLEIITNINDLMSFIAYHRHCIKGVFAVQAKCCWYDFFEWKCKMVVTKRDGKVETYKGNMNDFMVAYGLRQF